MFKGLVESEPFWFTLARFFYYRTINFFQTDLLDCSLRAAYFTFKILDYHLELSHGG